MKKTVIIGIATAIIIAGGLGIFAVSNTEEPQGDELTVSIDEEATATVEENLGVEGDEYGFEDEATATVEEDSDEKGGDGLGFGDEASITVENP